MEFPRYETPTNKKKSDQELGVGGGKEAELQKVVKCSWIRFDSYKIFLKVHYLTYWLELFRVMRKYWP